MITLPPDAPAEPPKSPKSPKYRKPVRVRRTAKPRAAKPREAQDATAETVAFVENAEPARDAIGTAEEVTRTRRTRDQISADPFALPRNRMKPGWDYQWFPVSLLGQPVDGSTLSLAQEQGWRPEKRKDWPEFSRFDGGNDPNGVVDRMGQRLFSRPLALTMEARDEDYRYATQQLRDKVEGAAKGRLSGGEEGLGDIRGVVPRALQVEVFGEAGTYARGRKGPSAS